MNVIKNIYGSLMPLLAPQSGAFRIGANRYFHPNSSTFDHLSLYIQKHLGQSVSVCGSLRKGRSWQTKAEPGTARYSAEKTHHVIYIWKAGALRI